MITLIEGVVGGLGVTCGVTNVKVGDIYCDPLDTTYANIQEKIYM